MPLTLLVVHAPTSALLRRTFVLDPIPAVLGRGASATILLDAPGVSRVHARIERRGGEVWLVDESSNGTFVGAERIHEIRLEDGVVLGIGALSIRFLVDPPPPIVETIYDPDAPDGLTGLLTRAQARAEFQRLRASAEPLSVLALGIDGIRPINDDHGHDVGDAVIRAVAHGLSALARPGDVVYRHTGDELVWLLPRTPLDEALARAERARAAIAALEIPTRADPVRVTVSVGAALSGHPDTEVWPALEALWRAKKQGKNRMEREPEHG